MKKVIVTLFFTFLIIVPAIIIMNTMGAGGFKRMVKISGVYSVLKPDGYNVVCFLDADSKDGGMSCIPLASIAESKQK